MLNRLPLGLTAARLGPFAPANDAQRFAPSSVHGDRFSAAYCDGWASRLSNEIDPLVYARLMTPRGESRGQVALSEADVP